VDGEGVETVVKWVVDDVVEEWVQMEMTMVRYMVHDEVGIKMITLTQYIRHSPRP